jgi:hypothetical protein
MTDAAVAFAALITAVGTLLTAIVAAIVAVRSLKRTEKRVEAIDHAVNGVGQGSSTIRDNVQDLHDEKFDAEPSPLVQQIAALLKAEPPV